jgi:4-hydroxy-tetrahydrodipicolinate reductase
MSINVCLAGATGWVGGDLARAIHAADDLQLSGAIARSTAGKKLGEVLNIPGLDLVIYATAQEALGAPCDVFVEFSKPDSAKTHVLQALAADAHVVVGTSGLTDEDYAEIDHAALEANRGVLAAGNFALTAVLLLKFASMAAKYIPHWEVIDYAGAAKPDAPSGTARELAYRLGKVRQPELPVPIEQTVGPPESRGATLSGSQVHSIRLPGYVASVEAIFGLPDMQLSLRHDAGTGAQPYVDGTLLAIRKVSTLIGLHRGLDTIMDFTNIA